jgi:hypothetical protein
MTTTVAFPQTHIEWQAVVVDLLHSLGYQHLHVRRSIGKGHRWTTTTNIVGWPDLLAWHPRHGFAAIELKVGKDIATPEQIAVLVSLREAGARTMIAYPNDLDQVIKLLLGRPRMESGGDTG